MARVSDTLIDSIKLTIDYGIDTSARRVFFHGDLEFREDPGESYVEKVTKGLLLLDKTEGPIELWINSPGGFMSEMFGIYDIITTRKNRIITIGFGEIASAAGLILSCGDERRATENAFFMAHESSSVLEGSKSKVDDQIAVWARQNTKWAELMARHTKHDAKWWTRQWKTKRETWFDAKEMVEHGIVDSIVPRTPS